jgi:ribosomal protein L12E/L44/L45/RPP1/RPP2
VLHGSASYYYQPHSLIRISPRSATDKSAGKRAWTEKKKKKEEEKEEEKLEHCARISGDN